LTLSDEQKYLSSKKKVWLLYSAAVLCFIVFLVLVVAADNEERFFYSLMTIGASYAFRPNEQMIDSAVKKLFDVSPPPSSPDQE
jgi:hypothetical protein